MQNSSPIKVIIDTNLWISFLIGKQLSSLKPLLIEGKVQPVFSQQLLDELVRVTQRPKLQKYFAPQKVADLIEFLTAIGHLIDAQSVVTACRDPKDNYLLALAKDSRANFLITGDQDLLVLKTFEKTVIVTYKDFLEQHY
ncbi:MAG: putative toxin-antitoxin system toxin component, PIN family [Cyanobacteria bacterium P01_A01_bin.116]